MSFNWSEICSNWILQNCHEYNQDECIEAFTIIERYMGRDWLEEKYRYMKGLVAVIPILELGKILKILKESSKKTVISLQPHKGN